MKETLTCSICGKDWKRDVTRGRKPKACKKCFKQLLKESATQKSLKTKQSAPVKEVKQGRRKIYATRPEPVVDTKSEQKLEQGVNTHLDIRQVWNMLYPKPSNWQQLYADTKDGSTWQCPRCKWKMEVSVPLTDIPTHKCTPASRSQPLERVHS